MVETDPVTWIPLATGRPAGTRRWPRGVRASGPRSDLSAYLPVLVVRLPLDWPVAKPDGRLTHDLDPRDRPPRDACGVFGVWSPGEDVAKLAYYGLYALQHRGQESAGIAVSDGARIVVYKDMGLVAQVFDESVLNTLRGHIAVGHCRYSTTRLLGVGERPADVPVHAVGRLALGHNGNLINTLELAALVERRDAVARPGGAPPTPTC